MTNPNQSTPRSTTVNDTNRDAPVPTKQNRGNLNIKMVALPKCVKLRSFKCPSCDYSSQSEKEQNMHHKTVHGTLKCTVCNASFDTPNRLHCHKYKHSDLKYVCETCGEMFPFSSQLKDHRTKHLTGRGFACFAKDCGKTFKNNSSLLRHVKVKNLLLSGGGLSIQYHCRKEPEIAHGLTFGHPQL